MINILWNRWTVQNFTNGISPLCRNNVDFMRKVCTIHMPFGYESTVIPQWCVFLSQKNCSRSSRWSLIHFVCIGVSPLDWWQLRGSNSNVGKMDQIWSNHHCSFLIELKSWGTLWFESHFLCCLYEVGLYVCSNANSQNLVWMMRIHYKDVWWREPQTNRCGGS